MHEDVIHRWPSGTRPRYYATPRAWALLDLMNREGRWGPDLERALEVASLRDVRGAYFLTRDLDGLRQRKVLTDGPDAGRQKRIRIRRALTRAFGEKRLRREQENRSREVERLLRHWMATPPARVGWRLRTPWQAVHVAMQPWSLETRLGLLAEMSEGSLAGGVAALRERKRHGREARRWPVGEPADAAQGLLEAASSLVRGLAASGVTLPPVEAQAPEGGRSCERHLVPLSDQETAPTTTSSRDLVASLRRIQGYSYREALRVVQDVLDALLFGIEDLHPGDRLRLDHIGRIECVWRKGHTARYFPDGTPMALPESLAFRLVISDQLKDHLKALRERETAPRPSIPAEAPDSSKA